MLNTSEKRMVVQQWVENASEEEVEIFYESVVEEGSESYSKELLAEMDRRRARYLAGESETFTLDQVNEEIGALRVSKYGI